MAYIQYTIMVTVALLLGPPWIVLPVWWLFGERYETSRES